MRRRSGFTIVEMLVSLALIIFIMVILTEAFSAGMKAFRDLKAIGDMQERLRTASVIIRSDLEADHFNDSSRISDSGFWDPSEGPRQQGFFRIVQGDVARPDLPEGTDADGNRSYRATNHSLHFTVRLSGNRREHFASAAVPPGSPLLTVGQPPARYQEPPPESVYNSQWYEVAYFMRPALDENNRQVFAGNTPLYALYRRQRVLLPNAHATVMNTTAPRPSALPAAAADYAEVSTLPDPTNTQVLYFNDPADITVPERRQSLGGLLGGLPSNEYKAFADEPNLNRLTGADLLLTDVVSFSVKIMTSPNGNFRDVPVVSTNTRLQGQRVYDTWSQVTDASFGDYKRWRILSRERPTTHTAPSPYLIHALEIVIRIWDVKTQITRQITIIQDM